MKMQHQGLARLRKLSGNLEAGLPIRALLQSGLGEASTVGGLPISADVMTDAGYTLRPVFRHLLLKRLA